VAIHCHIFGNVSEGSLSVQVTRIVQLIRVAAFLGFCLNGALKTFESPRSSPFTAPVRG